MFVTLNCDGKNLLMPRPGMTQSHFCSVLATNYGADCFQNKWTQARPGPRHVSASSLAVVKRRSGLSGGNKCCLEFHGVFQPTFIVPQGVIPGQMGPRLALASLNTSLHLHTILLSSLYLITKVNKLTEFRVLKHIWGPSFHFDQEILCSTILIKR